MGSDETANAQKLCIEVLEPLRARFGPLRISSGFRCQRLNAAVGGVADSAHVFGCAADVEPIGGWTPELTRGAMVAWLVANQQLPWDQAIDEGVGSSRWVHVGITRPGYAGPRFQALLYRGGAYVPFQA